MLRRLLLASAAWLAGSAPAWAEPGIWQRAREPGTEARVRARLRAEQLFQHAQEVAGDPDLARELSLGSAALLEVQPGRESEAAALIESGLREVPASDFKLESWFDLGIGAMKLGEFARAERAFAAALALAWDPDDRARCYRNRGRARALGGRMTAAVSDYRAAVGLARDGLGSALSHLGLGVALERNGDYPQGMVEIARAVALRVPAPPNRSLFVLDVPGLSWVPEYDEHYFRALSAMAVAQAAPDAIQAEGAYEDALASWERYLPAAEAQKARYVANAKRHKQRCLSELERLRRGGRVNR